MDNNKNIKLYSSTLDIDLAHKVRNIQVRFGDNFRTRAFGISEDHEIGQRFYEASLNADTGLWDIHKYEMSVLFQVGTSNNSFKDIVGEDKSLVVEKLCFFDALHHCALFEETEPSMQMVPCGESIEELSTEHYKTFAKNEGIPFDNDGYPIPAINGKTLINGTFPKGTRGIAKKTKLSEDENKSTALVKSGGGFLSDCFDEVANNNLSIESQINSYEQQESYRKEIDLIKDKFIRCFWYCDDLKYCFNKCVENKFSAELEDGFFMTTLLSVITLGTYPSFLIYNKIKNDISPTDQGSFESQLIHVEKAIKKIPDGPIKNCFQQFKKEVEIGFYTVWARDAYRNNKQKYIDKRLKSLRDATDKYGLSEVEFDGLHQKLLTGLSNNNFEEKFAKKMAEELERLEEMIENIEQYITPIQPQLPPPQRKLPAP